MRRLAVLLLALPFLCGCSALKYMYCTATEPQYVASITDGENAIGILEQHEIDGESVMCTWGATSGGMGKCVGIDEWEPQAWRLAREAVGADPDVCVTCEDGSTLCPPEAGWGRVRAMYR